MIYDIFENLDRISAKGSLLYRAIEFIRDFDLNQPDGNFELDGRDLFAMVKSYGTSPASAMRFESHQLYIDVQALIVGKERIDVALAEKLKVLTPYSGEKDVAFFEPPEHFSSVVMGPGNFVVLYPEDIHRPNVNLADSLRVRKIVVKVKL